MTGLSTRFPWLENFPNVILHTSVALRDGHPGYHAAKSGDTEAALTLAIDLLEQQAVIDLGNIAAGRSAKLLPVVADEIMGFNAIPDAMAQILSRKLESSVIAGEIV